MKLKPMALKYVKKELSIKGWYCYVPEKYWKIKWYLRLLGLSK